MGPLVVELIPTALGIVLSPLAIMALVAVLLSRLARVNGIAYLIGWAIGLGGLLVLFIWIFQLLDLRPHSGTPPAWVAVVRLILGVLFVCGAIWVYRKGAGRIRRMAAASTPKEVARAATLPGWLQSVSTFKPLRSLLLGVGLFVLNPVDASCAIVAALDIAQADITATEAALAAIGFWTVGILPIAVPVIWMLVAGAKAQPTLDALRTWIAGHTHVLNAALLLVIGVLQLQKAASALIS